LGLKEGRGPPGGGGGGAKRAVLVTNDA